MRRKPNKKKLQTRKGIDENSAFYDEFFKFTDKLRKKIIELRQKYGLTQEQMQDFEINLRQFQRIESGETRNPTLANLFKIAAALKMKIDDLLKI